MADVNEVPTYADFRAVIAAWPSRTAMAADLEQKHWLTEAWHRKNSIPPRWFAPVIRAAIKRDIDGVSQEVLLRLHVKRMEEGPPEPVPARKKWLAGGAEA